MAWLDSPEWSVCKYLDRTQVEYHGVIIEITTVVYPEVEIRWQCISAQGDPQCFKIFPYETTLWCSLKLENELPTLRSHTKFFARINHRHAVAAAVTALIGATRFE